MKKTLAKIILGTALATGITGCARPYKPIETWPGPQEVTRSALTNGEYSKQIKYNNPTWEEINSFNNPKSPKSLQNILEYLKTIRYSLDLSNHLSLDY